MLPRATSLALVRASALLLVARCLVPAGAHLSELPNKIGSPADQYVLVQQIYRGWALFGILDHRRRAPDPLPQQGRAPCGAAVPGHPCRGACRPPACSGVARRLAAGAYLLLVVATNSGSSCARRSKDKKS
jgi:hypothetical protein